VVLETPPVRRDDEHALAGGQGGAGPEQSTARSLVFIGDEGANPGFAALNPL